MQTQLPDSLLATDRGRRADAILRSCVHCGLCNAVCPTYQLLGDELDGPRGRIYLIKGLLENSDETARAPQPELRAARTHLDRCLTCRGCEVACPSGVQYGELLEIGREIVEERKIVRAPLDALARQLLGWLAPHPDRFAILVRLGLLCRWILPATLAKVLPSHGDWEGDKAVLARSETAAPTASEPPAASTGSQAFSVRSEMTASGRRALLLRGCVQRSSTPTVNAAAARLLAANGVEPLWADGERCCGGLNLHLGQVRKARQIMRETVDALRPKLDEVDVIVSTASGCGVTVKDYGRLLADDPDYAQAAAAIAAKTRDLAEVAAPFTHLAAAEGKNQPAIATKARSMGSLAAGNGIGHSTKQHAARSDSPSTKSAHTLVRLVKRMIPNSSRGKSPQPGRNGKVVAWHAPCTLRHGQRVTGLVENLLRRAGYELLDVRDAHLCCGSAGIYSLLQRRLAGKLREEKLANLMAGGPDFIVTANVGCQTHLAAAATVPVLHWAELLAPPAPARQRVVAAATTAVDYS